VKVAKLLSNNCHIPDSAVVAYILKESLHNPSCLQIQGRAVL